MIYVEEIVLDEDAIEVLLTLSLDWENEHVVYGYTHNELKDLEGRRVFIAKDGDQVIGYLFGKEFLHPSTSVIAKGTLCFEIEELYVKREYRSNSIGSQLFNLLEQQLTQEGISFITLSMASKNYKKLLHFYIDICGMDFWHAKLFKKIDLK